MNVSHWFGVILLAAFFLAGTACQTAAIATNQVPGVSEDEVLFGQSAVLSGPSQYLGTSMRLGIETAFHEANQKGGVHGRYLSLESMDDSYETEYAVHATTHLIEKTQVFALIGAVGTPTSWGALPIAQADGVPFIAPFTGAEFLRDPSLNNVINLRASYYQESERIIDHLTSEDGIIRIGVFYQNDSFGAAGLQGVRRALEQRGMEIFDTWQYERNAGGVDDAASQIIAAKPDAVVMFGTPEAVANLVKLVRKEADPRFATVSFAGGKTLPNKLGENRKDIYVTQVVPFYDDIQLPVVASYNAALRAYNPSASPDFVSLEGYLAARLAISLLDACGPDLTRGCFIEPALSHNEIDLDGLILEYGVGDNQGLDQVYLTVLDENGEYQQIGD
ncbi:MAG: ABC transporter substrate-binding protein [Chloroflexi bacterium]|nr:ABC transporter substrate-binding protein [Chloroflexota bacterium]